MVEGAQKRIYGLWTGRKFGEVPKTEEVSVFQQGGGLAAHLEFIQKGGAHGGFKQRMALLFLGGSCGYEACVGCTSLQICGIMYASGKPATPKAAFGFRRDNKRKRICIDSEEWNFGYCYQRKKNQETGNL